MARFVVTLSEEHRAKLETFRARSGLRSEADAVRALIEASDRLTVAHTSAPVRVALPVPDKAVTDGLAIQVGPVARRPGTMLKGKR